MSPAMMKAARFHGREDLRVDEIPVPTCGKGQVKVKPVWCGICGSDLHEYLGGPSICPTTTPHPITNETIPLVFGHEFSAEVEEIGVGVKGIKVGDRVVVEPIIWDGTCKSCLAGMHNACDKGGFIGLSGWGGGLSEHCVVPADAIYHVPDNVSMEVAALVEPLSVAYHACEVSPLKPGDSVLVLGGGPIGLGVIQCLKAQGAGTIIVSEMAQRRKEYATQFGADHVLDPSKDDVPARCRELTGGEGVDVVFDAAGVQAGLDDGFNALRVRGTVVNIALWEKPATIHPTELLRKEKKYMGVITYARGDFQKVLDAISSGKMKPEGMITRKIKLDDVVKAGFGALIHDKANQVKILVDSSAS